jgi:hypothetical protein
MPSGRQKRILSGKKLLGPNCINGKGIETVLFEIEMIEQISKQANPEKTSTDYAEVSCKESRGDKLK